MNNTLKHRSLLFLTAGLFFNSFEAMQPEKKTKRQRHDKDFAVKKRRKIESDTAHVNQQLSGKSIEEIVKVVESLYYNTDLIKHYSHRGVIGIDGIINYLAEQTETDEINIILSFVTKKEPIIYEVMFRLNDYINNCQYQTEICIKGLLEHLAYIIKNKINDPEYSLEKEMTNKALAFIKDSLKQIASLVNINQFIIPLDMNTGTSELFSVFVHKLLNNSPIENDITKLTNLSKNNLTRSMPQGMPLNEWEIINRYLTENYEDVSSSEAYKIHNCDVSDTSKRIFLKAYRDRAPKTAQLELINYCLPYDPDVTNHIVLLLQAGFGDLPLEQDFIYQMLFTLFDYIKNDIQELIPVNSSSDQIKTYKLVKELILYSELFQSDKNIKFILNKNVTLDQSETLDNLISLAKLARFFLEKINVKSPDFTFTEQENIHVKDMMSYAIEQDENSQRNPLNDPYTVQNYKIIYLFIKNSLGISSELL